MMAWAIFPKPAFADGTVNWTGQGDNEPCDEGETPGFHWVFTPGGNNTVTDADLTVNGIGPVQMTGNGNGPPFGSWSADVVSGEVTSASFSLTE